MTVEITQNNTVETTQGAGIVNPAGGATYLAAKRVLDVIGAMLLLVFLLPLFLLLAIGIKFGSPGPVFYRWPVVGKGGSPFTSYKFRTMVTDADRLKSSLLEQNEMEGPVFKMKNDPRITPVGKLLRKFSIDELPQLWSVLKGDMSFVGPRPPLQSEYARFTDWQSQKLSVKPGITCTWQVMGRNRVSDFQHWVELDLEYIQRRGFWYDLKILLLTVPAVVRGTGR
jgi:lipopolysaccharide/colanic/teichoic acid biosynthesis glycosyltransferase